LEVTVEVNVACVIDDNVVDNSVPPEASQYSVVPSSDSNAVNVHGLVAPRPEPHVFVPSVPVTLNVPSAVPGRELVVQDKHIASSATPLARTETCGFIGARLLRHTIAGLC
jgi:hypothetical protein